MIAVEVRKLVPELLDDYMTLFDSFTPAIPEWAGCYCRFYHSQAQTADQWISSTANSNRAAVADLIKAGRHQGMLAYVDGRPIGWCHAAGRQSLPGIPRLLGDHYDEAPGVGSILCFAVAAWYRRQTVAGQLLQAACDQFRNDGFTVAEAYPPIGAPSERHYHGTLSMYRKAGFALVGDLEHYCVVRKSLV